MSPTALVIFWVSAAALAYTPFGYLACLAIISRLVGGFSRTRSRRRQPWVSASGDASYNQGGVYARAAIRPSVTLIIPVHNGANLIRRKIENLRALDYPPELLEVIVVDDCSADDTAEIAASDLLPNLYCLALDRRLGKPAALNAGLEIASGEIIGFTDLAPMLQPDALSTAVERFADPNVGCVSSEDVIVSKGGVGSGEGLYTRIDTHLRRFESAISSCAGMSGSFYLVRRELCPPFPLDLATDMFSALHCVDRGYRAVVEERSKVEIAAQPDAGREFERKTRTMVTGLRALRAFRRLLNPARSGIFAWFLASHKLMRYLTPLFVVTLLFSSAYLGPGNAAFRWFFAIQLAALCIGTLQVLMQTSAFMSRVPGAPAFFCTTLAAAVAGWYQFITGERYETWQPTERSAV